MLGKRNHSFMLENYSCINARSYNASVFLDNGTCMFYGTDRQDSQEFSELSVGSRLCNWSEGCFVRKTLLDRDDPFFNDDEPQTTAMVKSHELPHAFHIEPPVEELKCLAISCQESTDMMLWSPPLKSKNESADELSELPTDSSTEPKKRQEKFERKR